MTAAIALPGRVEPLEIAAPGWAHGYSSPASRRVYAAAHVASVDSGDLIDWQATLRFRDHLWEHGFAVAEAMDTAQRGMGLPWGLAQPSSSPAHADARRQSRRASRPVRRPGLRVPGTDQLAATAADRP